MKRYKNVNLEKKTKERLIKNIKVTWILSIIGLWLLLFINFNVISNNEKVTLWVHAPSIVSQNEPFEITVEAWDQYERVAGTFQGEISFKLESYNYNTLNEFDGTARLPDDYKFTSNFIWNGLIPAYKVKGADNGKKTFIMNIPSPGIHYIRVMEKDSGNTYRSNPVIVKPIGESFKKLYWGDIHGHTLLSDGSGTPEETYEFARDVALLDFAALTDHVELFPRFGDVDLFNRFQNYIGITNQFNDDGEFATIVAMEWTPWISGPNTPCSNGHLNVYFEDDDMPFYSSLTHQNPEDLYDALRENSNNDFISWNHHTIRNNMPADFGFYDEDVNTMVEIYSCHGSCEVCGSNNLYPQLNELDGNGYSIRDALKMGRKFGLMASGDSHDGRLGHSISHTDARTLSLQPYTFAAYHYGLSYTNGLTGIYVDELDRKSVFNALKTRSAYATTWINRHYIEFTINGLSVGEKDSTLKVPEKDSIREIEILICADGLSMNPNTVTNVKSIEIYKNSVIWKSRVNFDTPLIRITLQDDSVIVGTEYNDCVQKEDGNWYVNERSIKPINPSELNTNGADYYYVRMQDSEGGAAWIGPIWVEVS